DRERRGLAVEAARRQGEDRLLWSERPRDLPAVHAAAEIVPVKEIQRRPGAVRLDRYDCRVGPCRLGEARGPARHGGPREQDGGRGLDPDRLLHGRYHGRGQEGIAAELEEIVPDSDWLHLEQILPDVHDLGLGRIFGRGVRLIEPRPRASGRWQRRSSDLQVLVERERGEPYVLGRDHRWREAFRELPSALADRRVP